MRKIFISIFLLFAYEATVVGQEYKSAAQFQKELNEQFSNPEESPLKEKAKHFKGHEFFPIDSTYIVQAKFVRSLNALPFKMKTTTSRLPTYEKYGQATFVVQGKELTLNLYQNHDLRDSEEYKDYLFLPFTDLTNGAETYGGGRFIDMQIPDGDTVEIDFNKAYNPYCAYSKSYSCPIPPSENDLAVSIMAGVKKPKK